MHEVSVAIPERNNHNAAIARLRRFHFEGVDADNPVLMQMGHMELTIYQK